jgi:hypothetical protein
VKQIRQRLTYANVMSSIAVFLILGGATAFAAVKKIGANEIKANSIKTGKIVKEAVTATKIKKNAVITAKIADGAVTNAKIADNAVNGAKVEDGSLTGADLKLDTIGTVPSAKSAQTAQVAQFAGELTGRRIFFRVPPGTSQTQILNLGGLVLRATCTAGGALQVEAESTLGSAYIQGDSTDDGQNDFGNSKADPGDVFNVLPDSAEFAQGFIWFSGGAAGTVVSVQYQAKQDQPAEENNCSFTGTALAS